ncbi:MAG TPA: hypothetical protein VIE65_19425 [Methylobacter sp.]|jgi:predicted RNase H-like HicB family nuclease
MSSWHSIHFFKQQDDTYLVASADSPRFCFQAPTLEEVRAKAKRALEYYDVAKKRIDTSPKQTRVISPIYEKEEVCA